VAGCDQGQPIREAGALVGAAARRGYGHTRLQRGARKGGRLQGARKGGWLQGAAKWLPPTASPAASRGGDVGRRGGRPLVG
ncbi:hypothetical protein GW17_00061293, partial [Ensete ventricosum]